MSVLGSARDGVNRALRPTGVQLIRGSSADRAIQSFVPARKTVAAAHRAGMSLEAYFDNVSAGPGATAGTVNTMLALGELDTSVARVCEIGAGSGRYAARVVSALDPDVYEAYETASDWLPHLRRLPKVTLRPTDGHTLRPTSAASVDLVHAHKLFVYLPLVTTIGYLVEMTRVVRQGGVVAFDVVTESCLDPVSMSAWLAPDLGAGIYNMIPRGWVVDLLARQGASLLGGRFVPMSGGWTELLVFRRD